MKYFVTAYLVWAGLRVFMPDTAPEARLCYFVAAVYLSHWRGRYDRL